MVSCTCVKPSLNFPLGVPGAFPLIYVSRSLKCSLLNRLRLNIGEQKSGTLGVSWVKKRSTEGFRLEVTEVLHIYSKMIVLICSNGPLLTWSGPKTLKGAGTHPLIQGIQEIWFEEMGRTLGRPRQSLPALFSTFSTISNLACLGLAWQHVEREECEARTEPRVDLGVIRALSEPLSVSPCLERCVL